MFVLVIRKKFEKASAGNRSEFEEHYGFVIDNEQQINDICQNGYQCTESSFNVLGKYIFNCLILLLIYFTYYLVLYIKKTEQ